MGLWFGFDLLISLNCVHNQKDAIMKALTKAEVFELQAICRKQVDTSIRFRKLVVSAEALAKLPQAKDLPKRLNSVVVDLIRLKDDVTRAYPQYFRDES